MAKGHSANLSFNQPDLEFYHWRQGLKNQARKIVNEEPDLNIYYIPGSQVLGV